MQEPACPRDIIHVDMDCFYVSVERLRDPSLNGKPVAVGGSPDGRGVVSSASYEARKFGVRSAMPMGRALQLCPSLVVVQHSFGRYVEFSQQIEEILREFSPLVQMASQDEAYLDMAGTDRLHGGVLRAGQAIRDRILSATQLPCSIGIGGNKIVAKIASGLCKPRGFLWIPSGNQESFLAPLPIGVMPGIGAKAEEKLKELGITQLRHLQQIDPRLLQQHFGNQAAELINRSKGLSSSAVVNHEPARSIGAEETLDSDTRNPQAIDSLLARLAEKVAARLRDNQLHAQCITLKYRYSDFETHTAARTLPHPTNDDLEILECVREIFNKVWDKRLSIRLLGITGSQLYEESIQLDLIADQNRERRTRLHSAMDAIRHKYGSKQIHRGSSSG